MEVISSPALKAEIAGLQLSAEHQTAAAPVLAANVRLIAACLQRLPEILDGSLQITDVMFPGGSSELVEPIYKNPLLSAPFNEQLAGILCSYVGSLAQVPLSSPPRCFLYLWADVFSQGMLA